MEKHFDVVVIGGGSAGIAAAESAKRAGAKAVCLIEAGKLGGDCPWSACVPTKALLTAAKTYYQLRHDTAQLGIHATNVSFRLAEIMRRKDAVVSTVTGKGKRLGAYLSSFGVKVFLGQARFVSQKEIAVGAERITGKAFVLATGSQERIPEIAGLAEVSYWTYKDLVVLKSLPRSLAILGAGPVGVEFATFFAKLGVQVALFHTGPHILAREDEEVALFAEEKLRSFGVKIFTNTTPLGVRKEGKHIRVTYQVRCHPRASLLVDRLAIAVGKMPNVEGLHLEAAKVKVSSQGTVRVTDTLQTSAKHIFLAGDVSARMAFTHTAHYEGAIAGWNAVHIEEKTRFATVDLSVVPRVTFADPEIASVGVTAAEAVGMKKRIGVFRAPFSLLGRGAVDGKRDGFVKVVTEERSGKILGAHIIGERAGELIHELALAMKAGIPLQTVQGMLHAYPTYSEIFSALESV